MSDYPPTSSPPSGPTPEEVAGHTFPTARRGLDPDAVRSYLGELAEALRQARRRESELRGRLIDAERAGAHPVLDGAALSAAVGQETARVLQVAHEAAEEVLARARLSADEVLKGAEEILSAERRRATEAAAVITAKAGADAEKLSAETVERCREMIETARTARHQILTDLVGRRRELRIQLEQLRAGKEVLADIVDAVASYVVHSVEELKGQLDGAEELARRAAESAGNAAEAYVSEISEEELLAEAAVATLGTASAALSEVLEVDFLETSEAAAAPAESAPADSAPADSPPADSPPADSPPADSTPGSSSQGAAASSNGQLPTDDALESEAGQGPSDESVESTASATASPIDELFAKIRQSREEQVERARIVLEEAERELGAATAPLVEAALALAPTEGAAQGDTTTGQEIRSELSAAGNGTSTAATTQDDAAVAALAARDDLLTPVTAELARSIKRQLRLEQNELLDAFRNMKKGVGAESLLPGEEMRGRVAASVEEAVLTAFAAGRSFADDALGRSAGAKRRPPQTVGVIAKALASMIVESIRRRLEVGLLESEEEATTAIGAAFREWKGAGADRAAAEFSVQAFSGGVLDAAKESGTPVLWLVDDGETRCPDCDDNAIAGAVAPGEPFPTGHEQPPIHPGCRCLLVLKPS